MDLAKFTVRELLALQVAAIEELRDRGVVRTSNNPLGDYAEWLVASVLGLTLEANSVAGYDATAADGTRFQIKARRVTPRNRSRQLSPIRNLHARDFDELVAVVFDEGFDVIEAVSIPHAAVAEYGSFRSHVNGHILHVRGVLLDDPRVESLRERLREANQALEPTG